MKTLVPLFTIVIFLTTIACGTQKTQTVFDPAILGSWRGCDGRVVAFTVEDDKIIGRYENIGSLGTFGFTQNEIGYELSSKGNSTYEGRVKWGKSDHKKFWKPVIIKVTGNTYTDKGSDACSEKMKRVTSGKNP